jgi:beta-galactosidase
MELLDADGAEVLCSYEHPAWGGTPAVTCNTFGKGSAVYVGCYFGAKAMRALLRQLLTRFGFKLSSCQFPLIIKEGTNAQGRLVHWYFNYSGEEQQVAEHPAGVELLGGHTLSKDEGFTLEPWGAAVIEE